MICETITRRRFGGYGEYDREVMTIECEDAVSTIELIQNTETGAEFYLNKSFSYADLLLIIFLSIFLIFSIFKIIWNFVWRKKF